ncbi:MAG: proline--tRNA ligase [Halobacteriovoraceae bacterium]|nr:proline--tRNA ligase [Halobacteriovoraceae bacterium]
MFAISPLRENDFPGWYQQVIKASDLAENSPVRGCMVIKPWGYGLWENIQALLDKVIKDTGHENAYFPLFIPLSFLEKEAKHVEGFAKECAVVTHHRLEENDGKLVPTGELEEPLVVRPTSETIIGESFSKWVNSYRDLPLLINQWANVVRWEMRPRIFLRTAEFLWQEGHTVHSTEKEAFEETLKMLKVYKDFAENELALPVIPGEKSEGERFPGASNTFTIEAMMQDGKALQAGTSHFLGQNFSKSSNIQFSNKNGDMEYAYTTSWGVSTRLIGGMIMVHGDDDGMRVPPRVAPQHIVILPIMPGKDAAKDEAVLECAQKLSKDLKAQSYSGREIRVRVDKRDKGGGEKNWEWIKKGIPLRVEIGPRDLESGTVMVARRDKAHRDKLKMSFEELNEKVPELLEEIQNNYFQQAKSFRDSNIETSLKTREEFESYFQRKEGNIGFVRAKWCGDPKTEEELKKLKVSIRCLPEDQNGKVGKCILTGQEATIEALFGRSY